MIYSHKNRLEEKVLRTSTAPFDFSKFTKREIQELITLMRRTMKEARGVGLSANQIGKNISVFVAQVENKFYAVFNPKIAKASGAVELEEGCLSVPDTYGVIARHERVTLEGFDRNGKKIKLKAWGLLAQVFQHEVDHLNGKLFIDKAEKLYSAAKSERLAGREQKLKDATEAK